MGPAFEIQSKKEFTMATARTIPRVQTAQTINFLYNGTTLTVSPQGVILDLGQSVNFANSSSSTAPVTIQFILNPPGPALFGSPPLSFTVDPGDTQTQTPSDDNGSANYKVSVNGSPVGSLYAIQNGASAAGGGPIYIQASASGNNVTTLPDPVAVPEGGTLEVIALDGDSYPITAPSGEFTPPLTESGEEVTATGSTGTYSYSISPAGPGAGPGGGKIVIVTT